MCRLMKKIYKLLIGLFLCLSVIFLILGFPTKTIKTQTLTITGNISDEQAAKETLRTLEKNIQAINDKDIDAYLSTIPASNWKETRVEMNEFFKEYDIKNELLSFEIKKQDKTHMLIQTQQKTINLGENNYKSHIAEANHTFVKKGNRWLIQETVITNTEFI